MIISQTPLRISFFGGGTDLPGFYHREPGWVLSTAIDKYIYVIVKERFDDRIRVGYTRTELVDSVDEIEHELVREALRRTGISKRLEISTMGDIPSGGSGLGSSSTVTVGLLNALYTYLGAPRDQAALAREACAIEMDVLGKPIGKQDQFIAAYGGQRFIKFCPDDGVEVEPLQVDATTMRGFGQRLMLFNTAVSRKAESVLAEQSQRTDVNMDALRAMKQLALDARMALQAGDLDRFGCLLHETWMLKRNLASRITSPEIDGYYTRARAAGAQGGKITGAGGGGYLLLFCPPEKQEAVRKEMAGLDELYINPERDGSKVIFNNRR
jgi:D-glycero-alpha-D-manno-heptose-7-phosphate kinase